MEREVWDWGGLGLGVSRVGGVCVSGAGLGWMGSLGLGGVWGWGEGLGWGDAGPGPQGRGSEVEG